MQVGSNRTRGGSKSKSMVQSVLALFLVAVGLFATQRVSGSKVFSRNLGTMATTNVFLTELLAVATAVELDRDELGQYASDRRD